MVARGAAAVSGRIGSYSHDALFVLLLCVCMSVCLGFHHVIIMTVRESREHACCILVAGAFVVVRFIDKLCLFARLCRPEALYQISIIQILSISRHLFTSEVMIMLSSPFRIMIQGRSNRA